MLEVLLSLLVVVLIIGFILWVVKKVPMDQTYKEVVSGLAILILVIYVIFVLGSLAGVTTFRVR